MDIQLVKDKKNKYVSQGGIHIIHQLFRQYGIDQYINRLFPGREKQSRYQDSEILLGLCYSIYCGSSFLEDVNRLRTTFTDPRHYHGIRIPSSDTIKYRIQQLSEETRMVVNKGKKGQIEHHFNLSEHANKILVQISKKTNPHWSITSQTVDYDNTLIHTTKGDSQKIYKGNYGYQPGIMFIGSIPVYVEGRGGHTPSNYLIDQTVERGVEVLKQEGVKVKRLRIDTAAFQKSMFEYLEKNPELIYYIRGRKGRDIWELEGKKRRGRTIQLKKNKTAQYIELEKFVPGGLEKDHTCRVIVYRYYDPDQQLDLFQDKYVYYAIYTNDRESTALEVIRQYNKRGEAEQNIERLKNDFNWIHPPFDNLACNTVYFILTAIANILYYWLLRKISKYFKEFRTRVRIKYFIFSFVNVVARWVKKGRKIILCLYTDRPYDKLLGFT